MTELTADNRVVPGPTGRCHRSIGANAKRIVALCLALISGCAANDTDIPLIVDLTGPQRFNLADEPAFASPDFDDSEWDTITVPGGWMEQGYPRTPYIGWYRLRFNLSEEESRRDLSFVVGPVNYAFEVFLNGERIGRSGGIHPLHMWGELARTRAYSLPPEHRNDGENLIAVRVQRIVSPGGFHRPPVGITESRVATKTLNTRNTREYVMTAAFIAFYAGSFSFSVLLFVLGFRDARHIWFSVVLLQIGLSHLFYGSLMELFGGAFFASVATGMVLDQFMPVTTWCFLRTALSAKPSRIAKSMLAAYILLCLAWWISAETKDLLLIWWWLLAAVILGPIGGWWCVQAIRRGNRNGWPLLIGLSIVIVANALLPFLVVVFKLDLMWTSRPWLVPADWYAWLCLHMCMIGTLGADYVRTTRHLRRASRAILQSHEQERQRLARELHDGVGQAMLAMKLNIDTLANQSGDDTERDSLKDLSRESSQIIDELHDVAVNLRSDVLEQMGLVVAVRQLTESLAQRTAIQFHIEGDETIDFGSDADHLYRIAQEAVNNAVRHAEPTRIEIVFQAAEKRRTITIRDNGTGFNMRETPDDQGLGLTSMKERAELLGGRLQIESKRGTGTTVTVEL